MARYRRFDVTTSTAETSRDAIEAVRVRRAGLKSAMSGLEVALAAPAPGRLEEWAAGVRDALGMLQEVWTRHIVETEAPGAFLDELVEEAPRLYNQSLRLRGSTARSCRSCWRSTIACSPITATPSGSNGCVPS